MGIRYYYLKIKSRTTEKYVEVIIELGDILQFQLNSDKSWNKIHMYIKSDAKKSWWASLIQLSSNMGPVIKAILL